MGKNKATKKAGGLGKALNNAIGKKSYEKQKYIEKHGAELLEIDKPKQISVVERNALDDFLYKAEIAQEKFEAVKGARVIVKEKNKDTLVIDVSQKSALTITDEEKQKVLNEMKYSRIPRRPVWDKVREVEEQILQENKDFIDWRRNLALNEEKYRFVTMTPYEKNVEIWKQLWRVLEKSDIVIQVLDARSPVFFRCEDLETYVKELSEKKINMLLINKADLVSEEIRKVWSEWLNKNNVQHLYFSAKEEQEKIDEDIDEEDPTRTIDDTKLQKEYRNTHKVINRSNQMQIVKSMVQIYKDQTEKNLEEGEKKPEEGVKNDYRKDIVTIGMCGFPNVGKSSIVNVLCKKKLVGVDARPGKTKNYQTIFLDKDLLLCDCPGLVFPTAASSKAEMICNSVLPVDNLRDFVTPVEYITQKIPKVVLCFLYKINLHSQETHVTANHILFAQATSRGYVTGSGEPDLTRAARLILKDYNSGKILYAHLPETYEQSTEYKPGQICQFNTQPADYVDQSGTQVDEDLVGPNAKKQSMNIKAKRFGAESIYMEHQQNNEFFGNTNIIREMEENEEENIVDMLAQEDILDLVKGKTVLGIKLDKEQRQLLKFAIKRDESTDAILLMIEEYVYGTRGTKYEGFEYMKYAVGENDTLEDLILTHNYLDYYQEILDLIKEMIKLNKNSIDILY